MCDRLQNMYWISFLQYISVDQHVIQYAYTTNAKQPYFCHFIKNRKGINTGMFYHAGLKCFKLRVLLHLGQLMDEFQTGFRHQCIFIILFFNIFFTVHKLIFKILIPKFEIS